MSGTANLTDYWDPKGQYPTIARMTAYIDSAQVYDFDHNYFNVKLRG